jgi:hypothetical protein
VFFDHQNISRAESVLLSRRASKKLANWIADTQHILGRVTRVRVEGKSNVLAGAGSRAPWRGEVAKHLPAPERPIREVLKLFFTARDQVKEEVESAARKAKLGDCKGSVHFESVRVGIEGNVPASTEEVAGLLTRPPEKQSRTTTNAQQQTAGFARP